MLEFLAINNTAVLIYFTIPLILLIVVVSAVILDKRSVPVILIALFAGLVFGSDGLNFWDFDNMSLANQFAQLALVFILFHSGFCTKTYTIRRVALPALGLATWGVILTAIFTFLCLHFLLGRDRNLSLLLSVIISSTDAAAIFSILRKQPLNKKLTATLEVESAANDPIAIMLTMIAVQSISSSADIKIPFLVLSFLWKFMAAPIMGYIIAKFVVWLINKLSPQETGYYHIIMICTAMFTYGIAEALNASGILAVFSAGIIIGNKKFVHKQGVYNFSSAFSTISNILLFILLGVLVEPKEWLQGDLIIKGILLFVILSFIARPLAVALGTIGMRLSLKDKAFTAWAGLRGAVPIVLATYPIAYGIENGKEIFNLVFFVVLLSLMIQGSSLGLFAKLLKISSKTRHESPYSLELFTKNDMEEGQKIDVYTVALPEPEGCIGPAIKDLKFPESTLLLMIARREKQYIKYNKIINILKRGKKNDLTKENYIWQVLPPRGDTILRGCDKITILSKIEDEKTVVDLLINSFGKK